MSSDLPSLDDKGTNDDGSHYVSTGSLASSRQKVQITITHLHFEDYNVFSHCMPSKATMSSSIFQRRQCLQSLHAFKRKQCLHLHFEDNNVFTSKTSISFSLVLRRTRCPLDTQRLSVHTFMLPQLVRSQVACADALYDNPHTFQRQKCLQSLHAFKGDNDPYLHFEDYNVFSHCMPSKATMSSSTFRRRQCLQSWHAFKRQQCLHLHFEDDNVFTSKTSISFSLVLRRTRRPFFVHFTKNGE
ncbi:hypothetical protein HKD37_U058377 [Glycine soja]